MNACELPDTALLQTYRQAGAYTDCFSAEFNGPVSHAEYVEAFYTTWVFKLERLLLAWFISRPSTDAQARAVASGERETFAAWSVEGRTANQLLMCDLHGRTRSWFMTDVVPDSDSRVTRLMFGSAVVPVTDARTGASRLGFTYRALLGFHKLYSRVLLRAAVARLRRSASA